MPVTDLNVVSSFLIETLPDGKPTVKLTGRALPHRPFALTGKQRGDLTWYPGSPEATVQLLGPEEAPTTVKGRWSDRLLQDAADLDVQTGPNESTAVASALATRRSTNIYYASQDGTPLLTAKALVDSIDRIRRMGLLVQVSWFTIQRVGYISQFTQTWHNTHDCEWELEFTWIAQGDYGSVAPGTREVDASDIAQKVITATSALIDQAAGFAQPLTPSMLDTLNGYLGALDRASAQVEDAVVSALSNTATNMEAARRAMSVYDYMLAQAGDLALEMEAQVDRMTLAIPNPATAAVGKCLQASRDNRAMGSRARDVGFQAARGRQRLLLALDSDTLHVYTAKSGEDLRDVALTYYGTANAWQTLASYNRLADSGLHAGQVILVPSRPDRGR